jgi:hypothetical protein
MSLTRDRLTELLEFDPETGFFRWRSSRGGWGANRTAGTVTFDDSRKIGIDGKQYRAQDLAWLWTRGELPKEPIGHRNGDRDDNRPENLCVASEGVAISIRNTTGYKGVSRIRNGKYLATIKVEGKSRYLGIFDKPDKAHTAYQRAASEKFARHMDN